MSYKYFLNLIHIFTSLPESTSNYRAVVASVKVQFRIFTHSFISPYLFLLVSCLQIDNSFIPTFRN